MTNINNWYIFNGVKGVIADMDNEKFAGIKPVARDGMVGFYALTDIEEKEITDNDCLLEYYDSYEKKNPVNIHEELVINQVVNVENKQCLYCGFINKTLFENDLYERMMCTVTDDTYEWISALTTLIYLAQSNSNRADVKELVEAKWQELCDSYGVLDTQYVEKMTFEEVWAIIEQNL